MTVRWTVIAANDRSRDRAARLNSCHSAHKEKGMLLHPFFLYALNNKNYKLGLLNPRGSER